MNKNLNLANAVFQTTTSASFLPRYHVLGVVYAPPGSKGGTSRGRSSVDYTKANTRGIATSSSSSFKHTEEIKAKVSAFENELEVGFKSSNTNSKSHSLTTKLTDQASFKFNGSQIEDGINHNEDIFILCLNPKVFLTSGQTGTIYWSLGTHDDKTALIQFIKVGQLKGDTELSEGEKQNLLHLDNYDKKQILALNPFSYSTNISDSTNIPDSTYIIDDQRFQLIGRAAYEPQSGATTVSSCLLSDQRIRTVLNSTETTYCASISTQIGIEVKPYKASLKATASFEWTNSSNTTNSTEDSVTSITSIVGPAVGWKGKTSIDVYWDNIYNSFMFAYTTILPNRHIS